jgi:hypothetical protein
MCKADAHGNQRKSQTTIEFTIVAVSEASDTVEQNMEEVVTPGKDALDRIKPTPSSLGRIQGAVDVCATVINHTESVSNTWGPILHKLKLFSELVDNIPEVTYRTDLPSSL